MATLNLTGFSGLIAGIVSQVTNSIIPDLTAHVTYTPAAGATYNTATGVVSTSSQTYTFNALFTRFKNEDIIDNTNIMRSDTIKAVVPATDAKFLVSTVDLPVEPRENDTLTAIPNNAATGLPNWTTGRKWKVLQVMSAPGAPIWIVHVRQA